MMRMGSAATLISFAFLAAGCGSSGDDTAASGDMHGSGGGSTSAGESSSSGGGNGTQPGQVTAGDWDDNLNFDRFQHYTAGNTALVQPDALLDSTDRVIIHVTNDDGLPISNARVTIAAGDTVLLSAPTASDGRLLFFPGHDAAGAEGMHVSIEPAPNTPGTAVTLDAPTGAEWTLVLPGAEPRAPLNLDLAFVLDTTGSMGDELRYLTVELDSISSMVQARAQGLSMRYALVVYRDAGDAYVTRSFDFMSDLDAFKGILAEQSAEGGGDTEEAVHKAVEAMNELSWRDDNAARVAFLVADAPPHDGEQAQLMQGVDRARRRGIKLYPVAASGADPRFEALMRSSAQWTLARYLFITDDSGIGSAHAEPTIPCYEVQYLNVLMTRLILSELEGRLIPPSPEDIVRSAGNPVDGICSFDDGSVARLY